ncbi:MAG: hypothetical protein NZ518_02625 [Dehalococcoidia bacterium]|nr:hypothetical protein [Dehalococcoidia bacterium]
MRSLVAGFIAVGVMTLVFWAGFGVAVALGQVNPATSPLAALPGGATVALWLYNLANNDLTRLAGNALAAAMAIQLGMGLLFSLIYTRFVERRLSGPGWRRGVIFALGLFALSLVVFYPIIGVGFFGLGINAGPFPTIGSLIMHLAYGAVLGWAASLPVVSVDTPIERAAMAGAEWGIAIGLVGGIVTGAAIGAIFGLVGGLPLSVSSGLVNGAVTGAGLGVIVGSILGLSRLTRHSEH